MIGVNLKHVENSTSANITLFQRGYTIREANHNHPCSNNSSSPGDVKVAEIIQKKFSRATFNNYTTIHGYTPYNKNTPTQMPTYELPEIIIKP